jgi:ABC-type dipeptide/oligopeptide/nickel transport system permease subunit
VVPLQIALIVAVIAVFTGRLASQIWVVRSYQAGRISSRNARWLIVAISAAPFLILLALMLVIEPGLWWVALLLFIATWPMIVFRSIVAIDGTSKPK